MKKLINLIACAIFSTFFSTATLNANSKPAFNDVAICRIQLKVKTNTIKNANSDASVWVQLNSKDAPFYLNLSKDDREKGQTDVYDVLSANVNKIGDIKMIKLGIKGGDGWNFRQMELIVNGVGLYKKSFSSAGQWIDSNDKKHPKYYKVGTSTLRASPNWRYNSRTNNIYRPPAVIPVTMIKSFVESAVGNSLFKVKEIKWGKKYGKEYVSVKRVNANTLRFDLDLKYEINHLPDPEVDVDFDLVFSCKNGVIRTSVKNYKSKLSGVSKYAAKGIKKLRGALLEACGKIPVPGSTIACEYGLNKIDKWLDFNFSYDGPGTVGFSKACTNLMKLDANGNLMLGSTGSPISRRKGPISSKSKDRVNKTIVVSKFSKKK